MLALANNRQSHTDKDNCRWSNLLHCPHRSMWHMEGRQHNRSYRDTERLLYVCLGESWSSPALLYIKAMHDSLTWGATNVMHTSCVWGGNPTECVYKEEIKAEQRPMRVSEGKTPIYNIQHMEEWHSLYIAYAWSVYICLFEGCETVYNRAGGLDNDTDVTSSSKTINRN